MRGRRLIFGAAVLLAALVLTGAPTAASGSTTDSQPVGGVPGGGPRTGPPGFDLDSPTYVPPRPPPCAPDECTEPPPPSFCTFQISETVSRGDDLAAGGEFSNVSWQSRVYCRNFHGSIGARSLLVDRTPGRDGTVIATGPFDLVGGYDPSMRSDSGTRLFDIDDIGDGPNVVEVLVEAELVSTGGPWAGCDPIAGLRYLRCDGVGTRVLEVVMGAEPVSAKKPNPLNETIRTRPPGVALTFDDGPHPVWTPKILDRLKEYGVKATFCVVGEQARLHPDLIRRIVKEGHAICNHSDDHSFSLGRQSTAVIRANLRATNQAILAAAPNAQIVYFRHPGGNFTLSSNEVTRQLGMKPLFWSVDPRDYDRPGTDSIISVVNGATTNGSIVLLHDGGGDRSQTHEALDTIIPYLQSLYDVVPL